MENNLTSEDYKRLAKEAADKEKQQKKNAEKEESDVISRWNSFVSAEKVLRETDMKFFRDGQPKYFRKLQTKSWHKITDVEFINTEVKFYPPTSLKENWLELKDDRARDMFRVMVEGGKLTVKNPETDEWVEETYPAKVYDKITNTLKKTDNKTYNMLDLSDKLTPKYDTTVVQTCPLIIKALMYSCSGNVIMYDEELCRFSGDKEENLIWLEKWIYGTVHADVGNNMASFPVFFGPGKVGKNALMDLLMKQLLGKDACFTGTWDIIHGNFDGYKLGKVFMFIDEVPEKGSWDQIKNMTGSTDSFVKQKYGAEFVIDNTVRYAIGTNEEVYPLPVETGPQMMRVSPIKLNSNSTFAENTVKIMDQTHGVGYCRKILQDSDNTLNVDKMDDFTVGDTLLRNIFNKDWCSRDSAQQFLNYLDYTYKSDTGHYSLEPLRGTDWRMITHDKMPAVQKVVDYLIEENIETITTLEMYEIYKVIQQERSDAMRKLAGFGQVIASLMTDNDYVQHKDTTLSNGIRTTIYTTTLNENFSDYVIDSDKYFTEINMGDGIISTKHKKLKYSVNNTSNIENRLALAKILRKNR